MELQPHQLAAIQAMAEQIRTGSTEVGCGAILIRDDGDAIRLNVEELRRRVAAQDDSPILIVGAGAHLPATDLTELVRCIPVAQAAPGRNYSMHESWSKPPRRIAQWKGEMNGRRR